MIIVISALLFPSLVQMWWILTITKPIGSKWSNKVTPQSFFNVKEVLEFPKHLEEEYFLPETSACKWRLTGPCIPWLLLTLSKHLRGAREISVTRDPQCFSDSSCFEMWHWPFYVTLGALLEQGRTNPSITNASNGLRMDYKGMFSTSLNSFPLSYPLHLY